MTRKPCSRCDSADKVADLERQLDATLMELAETQALELHHGAVIERLQRQLSEARDAVDDDWKADLSLMQYNDLKGTTP